MRLDLIYQRIEQKLVEKGLSASAASKRAGKTDAIANIKRALRAPERRSSVNLSTLQALAPVLGVSVAWLITGSDDGSGSDSEPERSIAALNVVGEVAAGVWREAVADAFEPIPETVPPDPRFPIAHQFLLRVRGSSINRQAGDGSLLLCLDADEAPRAARDGDWVVVRRMDHGSAETTVKQLRIVDGRREFWPDSTDERWKTPIVIEGTKSSDVKIQAFVLEFIRPATRF